MRIADIIQESYVDGPGIRFTVFTQGCSHKCPGCHNPQTHDFSGGREFTVDALLDMIQKDPLLDGLTLTGGEPFAQAEQCALLAEKVRALGLDVWTYTGYTFEQLLDDQSALNLLKNTDVLIDGPFILEKRSLSFLWRGSLNQRLVDVKQSLQAGRVVEYEPPKYVDPEKI